MPYGFDSKTKRYRDRNGKFIAQAEVRKAVRQLQERQSRQIRAFADQLASNRLTVGEWQWTMQKTLQAGHAVAFALPRGGMKNMSTSDWKELAEKTYRQYGYLNKFAADIAAGRIETADQIANRSRLYLMKVNATFAQSEQSVMKQIGKREARRIRTAVESCSSCVAASGKGWIDIDEMPPIGTLKCGQFCGCYLEFR